MDNIASYVWLKNYNYSVKLELWSVLAKIMKKQKKLKLNLKISGGYWVLNPCFIDLGVVACVGNCDTSFVMYRKLFNR